MIHMRTAGYKVLRGCKHRDFLRVAMELSNTSSVFSYAGGSYARESVGNEGLVDVGYTDSRHDLKVHNEMAYVQDYPSHIAFFAETPATGGGGETMLCDGRLVWRDLSRMARDTLSSNDLKYTQIYGNETLVYRNRNDYMALWQEVFGTESREVAQERAESLGYTVSWSIENEMEVSFQRRAVRYDMPKLVGGEGEAEAEADPGCFFDQIVCCHSKNCSAVTRDGRPHFHVTLDGREQQRVEIPASIMEEVEHLTELHTVMVELKEGDAIVIDNRMVKHGRRAFDGERSMIAALLC